MNKETLEMGYTTRFFFLFLFFAIIGNSNAQKSTLTLELRNIEILQGQLLISLSNDSLQFANFRNPTESRLRKVPVKSSTEIITFENLEAGWYAIAVFQDLNGNDSLDTKKFKIPAEPFGFSNNALAKFRPPWFQDARFYVVENKQLIQTINLINRKPKRVKTDTSKNEK